MVDVPQRLRSRFAMRSGGAGSAPVVEARNWPSVQHLIDQPVATAALPADYIRQRSPDGSSWIIRRRDANDAEFQRLTVRPGRFGARRITSVFSRPLASCAQSFVVSVHACDSSAVSLTAAETDAFGELRHSAH